MAHGWQVQMENRSKRATYLASLPIAGLAKALACDGGPSVYEIERMLCESAANERKVREIVHAFPEATMTEIIK